MAQRIQITVDFLASDYAPKISIFSGATENVRRDRYTVFPPPPALTNGSGRFHTPVVIHRLPQGHLEVAARRLSAAIRVTAAFILLLVGFWWALMAIRWFQAEQNSGLLYGGATAAALVSWATASGIYSWLPRFYVRIRMLDRAEYVEVLFPDRLRSVAEAYEAAYQRWIAANCPRHFGDPDDDGWGDLPVTQSEGWDQASKG